MYELSPGWAGQFVSGIDQCSCFCGWPPSAIAGVLIADYWIVRRKKLRLEDLYLIEGSYRYSRGWNLVAVIATLGGCALAWGGWVIPALKPLLNYGWFVGFGAAFGLYVILMRGTTALASRVSPVDQAQTPSR
jgi:NCS1 family nucleobase:cation symporter-1